MSEGKSPFFTLCFQKYCCQDQGGTEPRGGEGEWCHEFWASAKPSAYPSEWRDAT